MKREQLKNKQIVEDRNQSKEEGTQTVRSD